MRLQLALNVRDLAAAVSYYTKLFGVEPHKLRPGYANFAIEAPPLKLVLFESPDAPERLNHLGVEVMDDTELQAAADRLARNDILSHAEDGTVCCHAEQDKVWSVEPQGLQWEWYRITDDQPRPGQTAQQASSGCCR